MTSQASMWKLGEVRSNAKGGKFLCLEPLFWQSEASLEIPWEPRAFSEGQRPSVSFATDERSRLFWERAETDLVEQLAAASERVFDAKLTPEAVRQRLLPSVRQSRGGDWMLKAKLPAHARFCKAEQKDGLFVAKSMTSRWPGLSDMSETSPGNQQPNHLLARPV